MLAHRHIQTYANMYRNTVFTLHSRCTHTYKHMHTCTQILSLLSTLSAQTYLISHHLWIQTQCHTVSLHIHPYTLSTNIHIFTLSPHTHKTCMRTQILSPYTHTHLHTHSDARAHTYTQTENKDSPWSRIPSNQVSKLSKNVSTHFHHVFMAGRGL